MDEGESGATSKALAKPGRSGLVVTLTAWIVALVLIAALAFAVSRRLGEAGAALADAIARMGTSTSVAHESGAITMPDGEVLAPLMDTVVIDAAGRAVTPPRWIAVPSPDYPVTEDGDMVAGTVALRCDLTPAGRLVGCQILTETPPDRGFGQAALDSASLARLTPRMVDGVPTVGEVRFTIRFTPERPTPN